MFVVISSDKRLFVGEMKKPCWICIHSYLNCVLDCVQNWASGPSHPLNNVINFTIFSLTSVKIKQHNFNHCSCLVLYPIAW